MSDSLNSRGRVMRAEDALAAAYQFLGQNRLEDAEQIYKQLASASQAEPVRLLEAEIALQRQNLAAAQCALEGALIQFPDSPALRFKYAQVLWSARQRVAAMQQAQKAQSLCHDDIGLLIAIAQFFLEANIPTAAMPIWQRALALAPKESSVLFRTALCHYFLNEMEMADALLQRTLALYPDYGDAIHLRSKLRTFSRNDNHLADIRQRLDLLKAYPSDLAAAQYALAKELEDIGEYAQSFEALLAGATTKRRTLTYAVETELQAMDRIKALYTTERLASIKDGEPAPGPIFIVGMPRTGTTLVERILASHDKVASVGEITDFPTEMSALAAATQASRNLPADDLVAASFEMDFAALGRKYLDAVSQLAGGKPYFIDKLPFNFRYCGLILKALPNARIIHLTRDPMDTCYAVFKTLFYNVYHFSYQLDELAAFYIGYRQMMAHWHQVMPGRILDVSYESLVASQEAESRRILEYCGLPWQDSVLDFHKTETASTTASAAQIRRPIYRSSVQKWRQVAEQMEPVRQRLYAAGLVDADGNPC